MYNCALMFNVETKTPSHLAMLSDDDGEIAFNYKWRSRVTVCHGRLHYIRINSTGCRLSIWKMLSMTSDGWLVLHNVDLAGAVDRNLDILNQDRTSKGGVPHFKPIDMYCQGDDKVLLHYNHLGIVSYDMKRDVFELLRRRGLDPEFSFFLYTPTNMFLSPTGSYVEKTTQRGQVEKEDGELANYP